MAAPTRAPQGRLRLAATLGGRSLALLAALATLALAALFLRQSLHFFWGEVGPIYRDRSLSSQLDFSWFFYGMQVVWRHTDPAQRLYSIPAQDAFMKALHFPYDSSDLFGYPPPFALLWSPLAALPYVAARTLWTQLNLVALGVGLAAAAWHASPRFGLARFVVLGSAGLWATTLQSNFYWGQPNALTLALLALGLLGICQQRPRPWAAALGGVALGLAAVNKLTPLVVLAYLPLRWVLTRRTDRGRAAGIGACAGWATVAASSALSGQVLGWSTLSTYVRQTIPAVERSAWAHGPAPWNQALRGVLMLWEHNAHTLNHQALLFGVALFALVVLLGALRPALDVRLEAALCALLVLLCSPSLEDHHFTVAILPWILLGGYLLDRLPAWRRAWLWPLAGLFAVASLGLIAPARLHWPPALPVRAISVPVPPARYSRVFMLGAATYGPVTWTLHLRYRGAPTGALTAVWPDWWSPGQPLQPAIVGVAEERGTVNNAHVGLYAFGYPVSAAAPLLDLRLPSGLPQQNGGPEGLHLVAVTLQTAAGGFVQLHLPFNARGIAASARQGQAAPGSFDGGGNEFWSPDWPAGVLQERVGGTLVPFIPSSAQAAFNTLSAPEPAGAAVGPASRRQYLSTVFADAPGLVALGLLLLVAAVAAAGDGGAAA